MSFPYPDRQSGAQPPRAPSAEHSGQTCANCGSPTTNGADLDRGDGWKRIAICDIDCLSELLTQLGSSPGSQVRSCYPSRLDQV